MNTSSPLTLVVIIAVVIIVITAVIISFSSSAKTEKGEDSEKKEKTSEHGDYRPAPQPLFTEHVTPCEIVENGEFYLESDDPIAEKFPGIDGVIIYSGKGKSQAPSGRWKGPIKFFDPEDPLNGHKSFRIYPVRR